MSLVFHLTDATIHLLSAVGVCALVFVLFALIVASAAWFYQSTYKEGYHDGVQAAHAKPKIATKEEAKG